MQANGVNYYKGVLLCSRPNQSPSINRQKPFCGRVINQQQIGLVPTKQYNEHKTLKRQLPVLNNHKKWLEKFKKQIEQKKKIQSEEQLKKQQQLQKIRQEGRQRIKEVSSVNLQNEEPTSSQQTKEKTSPKENTSAPNPHKRKARPAWAQTEKEAEENEQTQVDDLLDFFQKGDTQQVKDYLTDDDVKKVLSDLKQKIESLRQQGNEWKNKELIKIEDQKNRQASEQKYDGKDDILSRISRQSAGQSVTSQKTVQRVEQLQKKKDAQKDWDNLSVSSSKKSSLASVDQQIAKHIADEILRNYPNLKHHSNHSIRKLLEKQAKQQLKA